MDCDVRTIHERFFGAWNRKDLAAMKALMHPDYTYIGPDGSKTVGRDAGFALTESEAAAFPDDQDTIFRLSVVDNRSIAEFTSVGTHLGDFGGFKATGRKISLLGSNVLTVVDGLIYEEREYYDTMTLYQQLGLAQAPKPPTTTATSS